MGQQQIVWLHQHCVGKLQDYGLELVVHEEGFAIQNVHNKKLTVGVRIAEFGTLEGVSAWIAGMEIGMFWTQQGVFE